MTIRFKQKHSFRDIENYIFHPYFTNRSALNRYKYRYGIFVTIRDQSARDITQIHISYSYMNKIKELVDDILDNHYDN